MYFDFYLKKPILIGQIEEIYHNIKKSFKEVKYSCPLQDMVKFTYNNNMYEYEIEKPSQSCKIIISDGIRIKIRAYEYTSDPFRSRIRNGERQLQMVFYSTRYEDYTFFIDEYPEYCHRLVPLVSIVAEISNAFFGMYGSDSEFTTRDRKKDEELRDIDSLEAILDKRNPTWATFYLDNQLFDDIGPEIISQWAEIVNVSGERGKFVERHGIPLCGSKWEEGFNEVDSIFNRKNEIYHRFMFPKIIKRIRAEYHYDDV